MLSHHQHARCLPGSAFRLSRDRNSMSVSWIDAASRNFSASSKLSSLIGWRGCNVCREDYHLPRLWWARAASRSCCTGSGQAAGMGSASPITCIITWHWLARSTSAITAKKNRANHGLRGNPDFPVRRVRVRMQLSALPCARDDCEHSLPLIREGRALQHAGLYLVEELLHAQ